jgi:hypothetical protein
MGRCANFWHFQKLVPVVQRSNNPVMIACKFKCYISKSKLVLSECNDLYFIAIAFTVRYMKSNSVQFFGGHPVVHVVLG